MLVSEQIKNTQSVTPTISSTTQGNRSAYHAGNEVANAKFSLNYPKEWQVTIQDDQSTKRINFYVIPSGVILRHGQNFWGGFTIDVYPPQSTIETWFSDFLSTPVNGMNNAMNNRNYYTYATNQVGNKTAYYIQISNTAPEIAKEGFLSRYVVLGKYYSYQIEFFENGEQGFENRIQNELFPMLNFQ
jgi:hypothetical protein